MRSLRKEETAMDKGLVLMLRVMVSVLSISNADAALIFSTGDPDGKIAMASGTVGALKVETADDFSLSQQTQITSATFIGLLTGPVTTSNIGAVSVDLYKVFPQDSTNPPSGNVPTRVNSPSDTAFDSPGLTFSVVTLSSSFTAGNSVVTGINQSPNQTTGGEGPVTGQEVEFTVTFTTPFDLAADHYFFVPMVDVSGGDFLWLSASIPIVAPGTPFTPDLQTWIRDSNLAPDWLRVGTDIVGGTPAPTYNAAFTIYGQPSSSGSIPEPGSLLLLAAGSLALFVTGRRRFYMPSFFPTIAARRGSPL
jgi:hypothetical protein